MKHGPNQSGRGGPARRRGGAYVLVLVTSVVVTATALSALALRGAQHRSAAASAEISAAERLAWSGLELALQRINTDANWRATTVDSAWTTPVTLGGGTVTMQVRDPSDGTLTDSVTEPVTVRSVGVAGSARHILEAELTNLEVPMTCLNVAAWARTGVTFSTLSVTNDQVISTNGNAHNNGSIVGGTVEAATFSQGGLLPVWTKAALGTPRDRPATTAFDYYLVHGTNIPYDSLSGSGGSGRYLRDVLLSPTSNPFGTGLNPRGIYIIDCGGQEITVRDLRVVGTLVLRNLASSNCAIEGTVAFEQAVAGFPVLLAQGNLIVRFDGQGLLGALLGSVPSRIRGPAYVSGNVTIPSGSPVLEGSFMVDGTLSVSAGATFRYVNLYDPPPPGFSKASPTNQMRPVAGSLRRVLE